jgi:hypothetical protein
MAHVDHAPLQDLTSSQSGSGDEHHLPHLYSHVGGTTVVLTQAELLVVVVEVMGVVLVEVMVDVSGGAVDVVVEVVVEVSGGAVDVEVEVGGSSVLLETGGS